MATGTSVQSRYYISSLASQAKTLLEAARSHWGIENSLHWSLDVTFREDHSRVRKDHGSPKPGGPTPDCPQYAEAKKPLSNGVSRVNGLKPVGSRTTSSRCSLG